jgi:5-methyltetrahydropteroyltriglutamate--homocysteine methyltransferase
MKTSNSRILITHVGSLPRGERLTDLLIEDELHPATDRTTLTAEIDRRVALVVQKQHEAGIDVANDGSKGGSVSKPIFRSG